jgi:catechol 2,3-dioxygenase-like lactoylglutathione lyase family enzyme
MFKRIDHVEIVTDQLHRTVQFYTEMLGFTVKALDRIESSSAGASRIRTRGPTWPSWVRSVGSSGVDLFWLQAPRHQPVAGHRVRTDQSAGPDGCTAGKAADDLGQQHL